MITYNFEFTLSKLAGFLCLAYAGWLIYLGEYESSGVWGLSGMAIFTGKNLSSKSRG